jgi:hypothetical protein
MTIITISTVGFSEIRPLSPGGRVITIFIIVTAKDLHPDIFVLSRTSDIANEK